MSQESAKAFINRMKTDENFRKKVISHADVESRKAFVFGEGFDFTAEELKKQGAELSEDDLEKVSAGGSGMAGWCKYNCVSEYLN